MPLGIGTALWAVILPTDTTNMAQNPSFEFGTSDWGTVTAGTIGTTSAFQQFGAWSGSFAPTSSTDCGARLLLGTQLFAGAWTISAYVKGQNAIPYRLAIAARGGASLGSATFTGGGTWARWAFQYTEVGGAAARDIWVTKANSADTGAIYIDAVQVESGSLTTYIDGDQQGGTWTGAQHSSPSARTGQYRGGGSVIALADIGLQVDQMPGAGVMPIEDSAQSYAITDGAQFQRQRAATRTFTLTAKPIVGTSLADFHVTRRTIWDAFKPDLVTNQQPVRFLYVGGQGTVQIDGYYAKGMELGNMDGVIAENAAISFAAYDPYWYTPTQQGTTLAPRVNLGSTNFIVKRSPQGVWGTLGASGTTIQHSTNAMEVRAIAINPAGTVFFGGNWGTVGGTVRTSIAMYYPALNTFGTLDAGTIGVGGAAGTVSALALSPSGTLYIGGRFNVVGGTAILAFCQWNGVNYGSVIGGTISGASADFVRALEYAGNGSLWIAGSITSLNGTTARHLGFWSNGASGTAGSIGGPVLALSQGGDGRMFFGGNFTGIAGQLGSYVGFSKDGALGTLSGGPLSDVVEALATTPSGVEYVGGDFTAPGLRTLSWNGVAYTEQGNGLNGRVWGLLSNAIDNSVIAAGEFTAATDNPLLGCIGQWNSNIWTPYDIDLAGAGLSNGTAFVVAQGGDNTIYVGGRFSGTSTAASVGSIVNNGRSFVYPMLRLRNLSGTADIYQLLNVTTGNIIYFNYKMQPGEITLLTLAPGSRSFQSSFQGNVFGKILPSSNLATWGLLPGRNLISFFSNNDSLEASLFWTPRGASIDSGTIF